LKQVIGWWSAGITSAVAIKQMLNSPLFNVIPIYFETGSAHPDNERFKRDCEDWYGQPIITFKQPKYSSVMDLLSKTTYVNGPAGAECTRSLKKEVRQVIEKWMPHSHQIFGFEYEPAQIKRAERFTEQYPNSHPIYPLIEWKTTKANCLYLLEQAGIEKPKMYEMGYQNNNCIGCVKGGMGYWNKIRVDFTKVFIVIAKMERKKKHSCINGVFLDELAPERGRYPDEIAPECGVYCELEK
jgi:hypothetical protein